VSKQGGSDLRIARVEGIATSFPVTGAVTLGIGRAVKRDAVVVKVTTEGGVTGWGESHHGRCPGAIAHLINTTLRQRLHDPIPEIGGWLASIIRASCGANANFVGQAVFAWFGSRQAAPIRWMAAIPFLYSPWPELVFTLCGCSSLLLGLDRMASYPGKNDSLARAN
jgi:hypothetical protein